MRRPLILCMKYFFIIFVIILLIAPLDAVIGAEALVTNNISNSQINQYIIIKCDTETCLSWLKTNEQLFQNNDVSSEVVDSQGSAPQTTGQVETQNLASLPDPVKIDVLEITKQNVHAREIRLNEIMSAPATGQKEWIELFNTLNIEVDVSDWKLVEGSGKETLLTGVIPAGGYAVYEKSGLNNDGDSIMLIDDGGQLIDEMSYGVWDDGNVIDNAPASISGQTLAFVDNIYKETEIPTPNQKNIFQLTLPEPIQVKTIVADVANTNNQAALTVQPVEATTSATTKVELPKTETIVEQKPVVAHQFSDKVRVNELLADPAGSDDFEWIELYNSGEIDVDLFGWTLDDSEGGSKPYKIDGQTIIKAKNFLVFKREETGLALNNSTDEARLIDPNGIVISNIAYSGTKENISLSFFTGGLEETTILTPGSENKKTALQLAQFEEKETTNSVTVINSTAKKQKIANDYYGLVDLKDIKELSLKKKVKIRGQVIVLPGVFSKNQIYLAGIDAENKMRDGVGIQVYFSKADWPELKLGEVVEVSGVVSESNGERRVLLQDKNNLKVTGLVEEEKSFSISSFDVNEENEGALAKIVGELVEKKPNNLVFSDEQGEFNVYLKKDAKIDVEKFKLGDKVELVGVIGSSNDKYRLMPRRQDDLKNLTWDERAVVGEGQVGNSEIQPDYFQSKVAVGLGFGLVVVLLTIAYLSRQRLFEVISRLRLWRTLKSRVIK